MHYDHQGFPSLHDKDDTQSHVASESHSSAKISALPSPEDFVGNKVSRKKKSRAPREDDFLLSIQNLEHEQDDSHHLNHVGQDR